MLISQGIQTSTTAIFDNFNRIILLKGECKYSTFIYLFILQLLSLLFPQMILMLPLKNAIAFDLNTGKILYEKLLALYQLILSAYQSMTP